MADVDGSGTINDGDELAMLLSYLNLEKHGEDCADRLKELLSQSLGAGISFEDFFGWLKKCLPRQHVWRDCPPPPPPPLPPSQPPRVISNPCWKVSDLGLTLRTPNPGPG